MTTSNLLSQGKAAFDARLAQLESARNQVEADAEALAGEIKAHIAAHAQEIEAANERLARVADQAAQRVGLPPALVLSTESKAQSWLAAHWRGLVFGIALAVCVVWVIRRV